MKTFEALAEAVAAEGVEVVFGLMGGGNEGLVGALVEKHGVRFVASRHEQAAVGMADGYSRATGKIGVASISHGPGVTNGGTTMVAARRNRSRLIVITSDFGAGQRLSNMYFDQVPFLQATIGAVQNLMSPSVLTEDVELAFRHVRSGKGPIAINTPHHVIEGTMPEGWRYRPRGLDSVPHQALPPAAGEVSKVAGLLASAKRPIILAGKGAVAADARDALLALAERSGALLATTLLAKNWFDGDAYNLGISGGFNAPSAFKIFKEADLVVAFGAGLNQVTTKAGTAFGDATIVQVDTDPAIVNDITTVDSAVIGDARLTAEALLAALGDGTPQTWRGPDLAARIAELNPWEGVDFSAPDGYVSPHLVAKLADEQLPKNRVLMTDIGNFMAIPAMHVGVQDPRDIQFPWIFGAVGNGIPQAIGAAVGRPDQPTVLFCGDGGLMMSLADLDSAVRAKVRLAVFVMDDGGFGAERPRYRERSIPLDLADYPNPDFSAVAASLGMASHRVTSEAELRAALNAIGDITGPTFVHCKIHPDAPFPEMQRYYAPTA